MTDLIIILVISTIFFGAGLDMVVNALRKRKYAAALLKAMELARWNGERGYWFRASDYEDALSVKDVLAVHKVYLDGIYEFGYSKGQDGIPDYVVFMEFYARSWEAEEMYLKGHAAGMQVALRVL